MGQAHHPNQPTQPVSLAEALESGPLPSWRALELISAFARGVALAHRHNHVIGCTDPSRVRLDPTGLRITLGRPSPEASVADDVRGLGAILYALLTGYWPLPRTSEGASGLPSAPRDPHGAPVAPRVLRPSIAVEVSELATAAIGYDTRRARLYTAAAVTRVAENLRRDWHADLLPPADTTPVDPAAVWRPDTPAPQPILSSDNAPRVTATMAGLSLLALAAVGYVGIHAASAFGLTPSPSPIVIPPDPPAAASAINAAPPAPPATSVSNEAADAPPQVAPPAARSSSEVTVGQSDTRTTNRHRHPHGDRRQADNHDQSDE